MPDEDRRDDQIEQPPVFTPEEDAILDQIWDAIGRDDPPPAPPTRFDDPGRTLREPYVPPSRR